MNDKVAFSQPGKHLTEGDIFVLEQRLNILLPKSYRRFLLEVNGGQPKPNAFPIHNFSRDTHGLLDHFFSWDPDDVDYDIVENAQVFRNRMPTELLPIAFDPGGNLLCLAVSGDNIGKVYYWDHEDEYPPGETPDYHNLYFVANDFDDLLGGLSELPL
jgi:hypothetical protein